MRRFLLSILPLLITVSTVLGGAADIRFMEGLDPREPLRIVVLPAILPKSVKKIEPRTVSTLLSTELLKEYEVLDLLRYEQIMQDRKFTINDTWNTKAQPVVIDNARVDAVVITEVYRWVEGKPGLLIMGKKGEYGIRVRLIDSETGSVLWSMNRIAPVKLDDFLAASTEVFSELVGDLNKKLRKESNRLLAAELAIARREQKTSNYEERMSIKRERMLLKFRQDSLDQVEAELQELAAATARQLEVEQTQAEEVPTTMDSEIPSETPEEVPIIILEEELPQEIPVETPTEEVETFQEANEPGPVELPPLFEEEKVEEKKEEETIELPPLDLDNLPDVFDEETEEGEEDDEE